MSYNQGVVRYSETKKLDECDSAEVVRLKNLYFPIRITTWQGGNLI